MENMLLTMDGNTVDSNSPCFNLQFGRSVAVGCYVREESETNENWIYVWAIMGSKEGDFKKLMDKLVTHFKTNNVRFTNVINPFIDKLKGFKVEERTDQHFPEIVTDYVGIWNI